jgi:hypothetical protein
LPDFVGTSFQKGKKYNEIGKPNGLGICHYFPFQGPPPCAQSGILGNKKYHLATLYILNPS